MAEPTHLQGRPYVLDNCNLLMALITRYLIFPHVFWHWYRLLDRLFPGAAVKNVVSGDDDDRGDDGDDSDDDADDDGGDGDDLFAFQGIRSVSEYIDAGNIVNLYQKGEKDNHGPTDSASPHHHTLLYK